MVGTVNCRNQPPLPTVLTFVFSDQEVRFLTVTTVFGRMVALVRIKGATRQRGLNLRAFFLARKEQEKSRQRQHSPQLSMRADVGDTDQKLVQQNVNDI